ncbi:hypothetical protein AGMMS50293_01090 [Spirochaetia bacterium]|nr:hypothetical protein AGMMS50293_01090 [Spirochaetia bacterium]
MDYLGQGQMNLNALDFRTGEMDWDTANGSWYSVGTIANALSAGVRAGVDTGFKAKFGENQALNKYLKGQYNHNNEGEILLNNLLLGAGNEQAAKLAAVMAHEGKHAEGIQYEALAHLQGLSTYDAITSIFGLSGDSEFRTKMMDGTEYAMYGEWYKALGEITEYLTILRSAEYEKLAPAETAAFEQYAADLVLANLTYAEMSGVRNRGEFEADTADSGGGMGEGAGETERRVQSVAAAVCGRVRGEDGSLGPELADDNM